MDGRRVAVDELVEVRVLGDFTVRYKGRELEALPPMATSLFSYLILNRDRKQTRDLLAGRFWSDLPDDRARRRLSNCLWQIRSAVAKQELPELITTTSSTVQINQEVAFDVDAEDFERRLDDIEIAMRDRPNTWSLINSVDKAVESYRGDLLAGRYDDWIEPERERLQVRYQSALHHLVLLYKGRSDFERALRHARTLVDYNPLSEELHQEVMRIYALLGRANAAERQFETCKRILRSELNIDPTPETAELLERIRNEAPRTARFAPEHKSAAMIGRDHERSLLIKRVEELIGGAGGVALVEGDPGIGKSRLIEEIVSAAEWRKVRVMRSEHNELTRRSPYESLRQLLSHYTVGLRGEHLAEVLEPVWLRQAARVLPDLAYFLPPNLGVAPNLRPDEESKRTTEALVRALLAQGDLGPTLVVLEDVHWCDDDTIGVLVNAGNRLASSGLLLCLTYRRFEAEQAKTVWSGITALEALPSASRTTLKPFSAAEVNELAADRLSPEALPFLDGHRLAEITGGNPLYVIEALRNPSLVLSGEFEAGIGEMGTLSLPDAVASSLSARIAALPDETRVALETLAVLAEPASVAMVARVVGRDRLSVVEALTRLADQHLIEEVDGLCRFGHDQDRQVVYNLIEPERRAACHSQIFDVLVRQDCVRSDRLGYHARLAGRMAEAHRWFLDAGHGALALNGYQTAAGHLQRANDAAERAGLDLRERSADLLALEKVLDVLGRREEQASLLETLRTVELPVEVEQELLHREIWFLINTERLGEAISLAEGALAVTESQGGSTHGLLVALATARQHTGDLKEVIELAGQALAVAPDAKAMVAAQTVLGKAKVDSAAYDEGCEHLLIAIKEADRLGDLRSKVEALGYLANTQSHSGSTDQAQENFELALGLSREIGFRWGEGVNLLNLAVLHTWQGRGGLAFGLYDEARSALASVQDSRGGAFVDLNQAMLSLWVLGDADAAAERAESAAIYFRSIGHEANECLSLCVVADADLERNKRRMASLRVKDVLSRNTGRGSAVAEVQARRVKARLCEAAGEHGPALAELDHVLKLCKQLGLEAQVPIVSARAANLALDLGDPGRAKKLTEQALSNRMEGAEMAHIATWLCGRSLDRLGSEAEATLHFRAAYELLNRTLEGLPIDLVQLGRTRVSDHRELICDYERHFAIEQVVVLPAADAPTGRPLRSDEQIQVNLSVSQPSDWKMPTSSARRHQRIRRLVAQAAEQGASARVIDLASALGVSDRTIKRDLAELRSRGVNVMSRRL